MDDTELNAWAARSVRSLLVRLLLNIAHDFERAAQERAER